MTIKVLIADDQQLVRAGLRGMLAGTADLEIVGEATNGAEAVVLAERLDPDVILMDVRMPGTNGVEATRQIRAAATPSGPGMVADGSAASGAASGDATRKVIVLTTYDLDEYAYEGLRAGASGFLLKDTLTADLVAAIRSVAAGDAVIAPSTTRRLVERFLDAAPAGHDDRARRDACRDALAVLTPRETQVLEQIARGLSNSEIAATLYLAETTVKTHVGRVLTKLGLRDRVQAVVFAYEVGLIRPGS